jgi:hypothetical protein
MPLRNRAGAVLVVLACAATAARATLITPAFQPYPLSCDGAPQQGVPFTVYLIADLAGDAAAFGITGAEFRVTGFDPAWLTTVTGNPSANVVLGSPIGEGTNIAFPSCQAVHTVVLFNIQVLSLGPVTPRVLTVERHVRPVHPVFPCPLVTLCDAPVFTKLCVTGGRACIQQEYTCCLLAVEATSWGQVKALYGGER